MGVRSSLLLLDQSGHASQGTAFALQMIVVALGIAVGLFASTLVVYPRKFHPVFPAKDPAVKTTFLTSPPFLFLFDLFSFSLMTVGKKRNALLTF